MDTGKPYAVKLWAGGNKGDEAGHGVGGGDEGDFWVEPEFELNFDASASNFWAVWAVDSVGVAQLEEILLTVRE